MKICAIFDNFLKEKNSFCGGKKYYTVDNFVEYIILWRKKPFTVDFV